MQPFALACSIGTVALLFGCSATDAHPPSANSAAGNAPVSSAGSGGTVPGGGGTASTADVGGSSHDSGGVGGGAGAGSAGSAGEGDTSGSAGRAGSAGSGGGAGTGGPKGSGDGTLGNGDYTGTGTSSKQYYTAADIKRNGQSYVLITNGWGPGFESHTISWNGTSFTVEQMQGKPGAGGQPASYPSVFCGQYSVMQKGDCGLPKAISELTSLKTGWRWAPNGNEKGKYNAAYDIWVGDATKFTGYLMVWLRDPPGYQPAGSPNPMYQGVTVANVEGKWDIWNGTVNGTRPIVNWVRHEGSDSHEIEFDVLDFVRDAEMRGLTIPGSTHIRAVAVGFEIWEGPITGLQSLDFYVNVK